MALAGVTRLALPASAAQSVTLGWDPSPDTNVVSYTVYYGVASGSYSSKISAGAATSATISGLREGQTYFFVVTASDVLNLESPPSEELSYSVPGVVLIIRRIQLSGFPNAFFIGSTGVPPPSWALQASADLRTWRTLTIGTASPVEVTVVTEGVPVLFFRLTSE
jgi:hypothetical protein